MSWTIRRMADGDVDAVVALAKKISEAPHWNSEEYLRCAAPEGAASLQRAGFVAGVEGELLGFSVGKLVAGVCELESVAVLPENRGQGIGRALFDAVAAWALAGGAARMELEVRASNYRAIKLYERAGLRSEGLRSTYYEAPEEDAVLMGKALLTGGKLS